MGTFVRMLPCEECGSSDNVALYTEDNTYNSTCFGCQNFIPLCDSQGRPLARKTRGEETMDDKLTANDIKELPIAGDRDRGIVKAIAELYGLRVAKVGGDDITHQYFPYHKDGKVVGYQEKDISAKAFKAIGHAKRDVQLQGQEIWPNGGGKYLVITEGFLDALAAQQMLSGKVESTKGRYPVVSLPAGAQAGSILKNIETREWVETFESVILMLDQDRVGENCAQAIATGLKAGLCKIAHFSEKDASDMLKEGKTDEFNKAFWNAPRYSPAGIVTASDVREILSEENMVESLPYPSFAPELNMGWYGKRKGEITLFAAGTGVGKSSFFKEDMYHIMANTDEKVGVVSLEESTRDIMMSMQSLYLNKRVNLPDVELSETETEESLDFLEKTLGERFVMLDHQGSSADDDLLAKIRYLIDIGCGYIYIDHITLATAGADNTNKAIDAFMDDLLKLCKKKNAPWFGVVSHLRKTSEGTPFEEGGVPSLDDLKGSGSIKQIAFDVIMFARNQGAKTDAVRNRTDIYVKKSRATGRTGPAGSYTFDSKTGRLKHVAKDDINDSDGDEAMEFEMH